MMWLDFLLNIMDKDWLHTTRNGNNYIHGVDDFFQFAKMNSMNFERVIFPCQIYLNVKTFIFE